MHIEYANLLGGKQFEPAEENPMIGWRGASRYYSKEYDQHYFELTEKPLGVYNKKQIDYCLGKEFHLRVSKKI